MTVDHRTAGATLKVGAPGLASLASERLLQRAPELPQRFGEGAFRLWKEHFVQRIEELSAALHDESPQCFGDRVKWSSLSFRARGADTADLRHSVEALREVLGEELPDGAKSVVDDYLQHALQRLAEPDVEPNCGLDPATPEGRLAARYLEAVLAGDSRAARELVLRAVREGERDVSQVVRRSLMPAQKELGRLWLLGEISVGEEHYATATTKRLISQLLLLAEPADLHGHSVVIASVQGDGHDVGLDALSALLELDGWRVVALGADVPVQDLVDAARVFEAGLVVLSATLDQHRPVLRRTIARLRELEQAHSDPPRPILVGGGAFTSDRELWSRTGANAGVSSLEEALRVARELVGLPVGPGD